MAASYPFYCCLCSAVFLVSFTTFIHHINGYIYRFKFTGEGGTIKSPHYPSNYPVNITCFWTLVARSPYKRQRIQLTFRDFRLEKNKKCVYDYIQIREFNPATGHPVRQSAKYCGGIIPPRYISTTDKIELRFVSDRHGDVDKGFYAVWKVIPQASITTAPSSKPTQLTTKKIPTTKSPTTTTPTTESVIKPCPTRTVFVTKTISICPTPTPTTACNCNKKTTTKTVTIGGSNNKKTVDGTKTTTKTDATPTPTSKNKCINSVMEERKGTSKDDNDSLAITFGCLLFVLIITNVALVIILCKKERRLDCSLTEMKLWITRKSNRPNSSRIYIPSISRPTLRMIDGDIVVLSSEGVSLPPQGAPPMKNDTCMQATIYDTQTIPMRKGSSKNPLQSTFSGHHASHANNSYFDIKNFGNISTHSGDLTLHSQQSQPSSTLLSVAMSSRSRRSADAYFEEEDGEETESKRFNTPGISDGSESDY